MRIVLASTLMFVGILITAPEPASAFPNVCNLCGCCPPHHFIPYIVRHPK